MSDLYNIVKVPDPVLKEVAHSIENISAETQSQITRMVNTMYKDAGIGLAANQIGILNRVFVMDLPEGTWDYAGEKDGVKIIEGNYRSGARDPLMEKSARAFINPEVIWESEEKSMYEEGCLSIPGQYAEVIRPARVRVSFQDEKGQSHEEEFEGLHSHCVQHEIDHLNGVLFIDYLSSLKRNMIMRRMKKYQKESQAVR
jgi:peptide deformylase